jgi:hypothetical protein
MYSVQVELAETAILKLIRLWEDYRLFTAQICAALEGVEELLLREHDDWRAQHIKLETPTSIDDVPF